MKRARRIVLACLYYNLAYQRNCKLVFFRRLDRAAIAMFREPMTSRNNNLRVGDEHTRLRKEKLELLYHLLTR